jgi:hypothetical protein
MRNLKFLGVCLLYVLLCARVSAQVSSSNRDINKPRLFTNLPDRIAVSAEDLKLLFNDGAEAGKAVHMGFRDRKLPGLSGKIVSATSKYNDKIHTLIIRSSNFSGATLTLSSSTQPDGTVLYAGRIISFQHADLYELEKQNEEYILIKKNFRDLISD